MGRYIQVNPKKIGKKKKIKNCCENWRQLLLEKEQTVGIRASAVVVFLFLGGLWFTGAIINGPNTQS